MVGLTRDAKPLQVISWRVVILILVGIQLYGHHNKTWQKKKHLHVNQVRISPIKGEHIRPTAWAQRESNSTSSSIELYWGRYIEIGDVLSLSFCNFKNSPIFAEVGKNFSKQFCYSDNIK